MPAENTEGIILRKYELRETSYILVVYTPRHGKLRGVLKGVRKPYPQFGANFELFSRCELVFYKRKRSLLDLFTHCECRDYYLDARKDIERLTYANYIIELVDKVTTDDDPDERLYDLLKGTMELMATGASAKRIARIFEIKLLGAVGLAPGLEGCSSCGAETGSRTLFDVPTGGLVCGKCASTSAGALELSRGTLNFLKKVTSLPLERTRRIKVSREVGEETERMLGAFMRYHIEGRIRSLEFMEQLEFLKKGKAIGTG